MKQLLKHRIASVSGVAAIVGLALSPAIASAVTDSANTTVNATIASTISVATSGPVNLAVTPVSGGSQTSASDTVTVNTNNAAGYNLAMADADATTTLTNNGSNTIAAHAGTPAAPTPLANNSWGFAVAGSNSFDGTYSALNNVTSSTSKWAGVPATGSPVTLKTTSTVASGDATTVWYAVKADTSKPNGVYTDTVTYTATTRP